MSYWSGRVKTVKTVGEQQQMEDKLKTILSNTRKAVDENLKTLHPLIDNFVQECDPSLMTGALDSFCQRMKEVSINCTKSMNSFVGKVMEVSSQMQLENPPCDFSVVVFGSLARGEATPYSDVEYLFLIGDDSPASMAYFECLAMTTYFVFNNLGETPLKCFDIAELNGWFNDQAMCGVMIDGINEGAGNIPTGTGLTDSNSKFIVTVKGLLADYKHVLDNPTKESLRGDFTAMLSYLKEVYRWGHSHLLKEFLTQRDTLKINDARCQVNQEMLCADVQKFSQTYLSTAEFRANGYIMNAKKDFFRFPSILIYDLSILFEVREQTTWCTLEALHEQGKLSESVAASLRFLLSSACYVRLNTYSHLQKHDDSLTILWPLANQERIDGITPAPAHIHTNLFYKICEYTLPLKVHLNTHISDIKESLHQEVDQPSDLLLAIAHFQCSSYSSALSKFNEFFGVDLQEVPLLVVYGKIENATSNIELALVAMYVIAWTLFRCDSFGQAKEYFEHLKRRLTEDNKYYPKVLNGIGACLSGLGKIDEAVKFYREALELIAHLPVDMDSIGRLKANYGLNLALTGINHDLARVTCMEALQIFYNSAYCLSSYDTPGHHHQCEKVKDLSKLDDDELIEHLNTPTFRQAWCLRYLFVIFKMQRQYQRAIKYLQASVKMYQMIFRLHTYDVHLLKSANDLAIEHLNLHNFEQALETFETLLEAHLSLYGKETDCLGTASALGFKGHTLTNLHRTDEAKLCLFQSLEMLQRLGNERTIKIENAKVLRYIGLNYSTCKDGVRLALNFFQQSLDMYHSLNLANSCDAARVLIDMGAAYTKLSMFEEAHRKLETAKQIVEANHGKKAVAKSVGLVYRGIGNNYLMQDMRNEAKAMFEISHRVSSHLYRYVEPTHPFVTELKNLISVSS